MDVASFASNANDSSSSGLVAQSRPNFDSSHSQSANLMNPVFQPGQNLPPQIPRPVQNTSHQTFHQQFTFNQTEQLQSDVQTNYNSNLDRTLSDRQCHLCGRICQSKNARNIHMAVHTGERRFPCTICSKRFSQKSNLNAHMKTVHKIIMEKTT